VAPIPPIVRCQPGDRVVLQTRDAFDGQMGPDATLDTVGAPNLNVVHPLTGPVFVEGAEPGDLLEAHILDVEPDRYGYTVQVPGFGFLRDVFTEPYKVSWGMADGWAPSDDLPGVRIPGAPFMGTIGLAPDRELLERITAREQVDLDRGGAVLPPSADDAVPSDERIAAEAIRTIAPHETAGNVDIKHLSKGARLFFPVYAEGGLLCAGDAHYAQGDCETCAPRSRCGRPCTWSSRRTRAAHASAASATCSSRGRTTACRPSSRRRSGSSPPQGCP
jgi:formamidase